MTSRPLLAKTVAQIFKMNLFLLYHLLPQVGKAVGLDGSTLDSALKSIKDSSVKERLKTYTQEALDYGVGTDIIGRIYEEMLIQNITKL